MRAAWYESQGEARDVLVVGTMEDPAPSPGEVRIAVQRSGINPGDVKKRSDAFGVGMPYPRVIPHSDGSGSIDAVGEGVPGELVGERVWCFGAQSYRPFGTAAEFVVVPVEQVTRLPSSASWTRGLVWASRASRLIEPFTWAETSKVAWCSSRVGPARSGWRPWRSQSTRVLRSSLRSGAKRIRRSLAVRARTKFSGQTDWTRSRW